MWNQRWQFKHQQVKTYPIILKSTLKIVPYNPFWTKETGIYCVTTVSILYLWTVWCLCPGMSLNYISKLYLAWAELSWSLCCTVTLLWRETILDSKNVKSTRLNSMWTVETLKHQEHFRPVTTRLCPIVHIKIFSYSFICWCSAPIFYFACQQKPIRCWVLPDSILKAQSMEIRCLCPLLASDLWDPYEIGSTSQCRCVETHYEKGCRSKCSLYGLNK
jgi:hypothetical protein